MPERKTEEGTNGKEDREGDEAGVSSSGACLIRKAALEKDVKEWENELYKFPRGGHKP